jgi:hypothetical protein
MLSPTTFREPSKKTAEQQGVASIIPAATRPTKRKAEDKNAGFKKAVTIRSGVSAGASSKSPFPNCVGLDTGSGTVVTRIEKMA